MQISKIPHKTELHLERYCNVSARLKDLCRAYVPGTKFSSGLELLSYLSLLSKICDLLSELYLDLSSSNASAADNILSSFKGLSKDEILADLQHKRDSLQKTLNDTVMLTAGLIEEGMDVTGYKDEFLIEQELASPSQLESAAGSDLSDPDAGDDVCADLLYYSA